MRLPVVGTFTRGALVCSILVFTILSVIHTKEIEGQEATAKTFERGKTLYESQCARCHGDTGRGDGKDSRRLGFHPRDFAMGSFKCRCTPSGALPTDQDLLRILTQGLPGTPMQPPDVQWTLEDKRALIQYVKHFSKRFGHETAPACILIPPRPANAENAADEGKQIYRIVRCWNCHGVRGRGDGPAAADLTDDWDRRIKPYNFTVLKKFKCGNDDRDLYRTLHTGMNGTPMPSYKDAMLFAGDLERERHPFLELFGAEETDAILAYLEKQPDAAALDAMSDKEKEALIAHRTWALVDYLRSLLRPAPQR